MSFGFLPVEVHHHITQYLTSIDKTLLAATSSRLRQIYSPSSFICSLVEIDSPIGSSYQNSHPAYRSIPLKALLDPDSFAWFPPRAVKVLVLSGPPNVAILNALAHQGLIQLCSLKKLVFDIPVRESINLNDSQIDSLFEKTSTAFNHLISASQSLSPPPPIIDLRVGDYSLVKNISPSAHINHISLRLLREPVEFIVIPPFKHLSSIHLDLARHSPREIYRRAFLSLAAIPTLDQVIVTYYVCDYYKLQPLLLLPETLSRCLLRFNLHPNALPQTLYPGNMSRFEIPQVTEFACESGVFSESAMSFIQNLYFPRLESLDGTVTPWVWRGLLKSRAPEQCFYDSLSLTSLRLGIYDHCFMFDLGALVVILGRLVNLKSLELDFTAFMEPETEVSSRPIFAAIFKYLHSIHPEIWALENSDTFNDFYDNVARTNLNASQNESELITDYSTIMAKEYAYLEGVMGSKEARVISVNMLMNLITHPDIAVAIPYCDLPLLFGHFPGACSLIPSEVDLVPSLKEFAAPQIYGESCLNLLNYYTHFRDSLHSPLQRTKVVENYIECMSSLNQSVFSGSHSQTTFQASSPSIKTPPSTNYYTHFNGAAVRFQQLALNELLMKTVYQKLHNLNLLTTTGFPGLAHSAWFAACVRSHPTLAKVVLLPSQDDRFYSTTLNGPAPQEFATATTTNVTTTQPMSFKEPDMFASILRATVVDLNAYRTSKIAATQTTPRSNTESGTVPNNTFPIHLHDGELHHVAPSAAQVLRPSSYHFC